jgi:hypothetical protein
VALVLKLLLGRHPTPERGVAQLASHLVQTLEELRLLGTHLVVLLELGMEALLVYGMVVLLVLGTAVPLLLVHKLVGGVVRPVQPVTGEGQAPTLQVVEVAGVMSQQVGVARANKLMVGMYSLKYTVFLAVLNSLRFTE